MVALYHATGCNYSATGRETPTALGLSSLVYIPRTAWDVVRNDPTGDHLLVLGDDNRRPFPVAHMND